MKNSFFNPVEYIDGHLKFDQLDVVKLAKKFKTPFYLYSENAFVYNYDLYHLAAKALHLNDLLICYALKANPNLHLLKSIAKKGAGADIVSKGELVNALKSGIKPDKIIFSGVGKTDQEIFEALDCSKDGIYSFNVESEDELFLINNIAGALNKVARVAFRFNPNIIAKTHRNIQTGGKYHKFGILEDDIYRLSEKMTLCRNVKLVGLSIHIGSQLTEFSALKQSIKKLLKLKNILNKEIEFIDFGGGLGVDYLGKNLRPNPSDYLKEVLFSLDEKSKALRLVFEPGRSISATSGILVTKVIRNKQSAEFNFTVVDAGLNDFIRPGLYHSYHQILPCKLVKGVKKIRTNVVGPVCETTDQFAANLLIHRPVKEDVLIIKDTGAYGQIMSSNYNLRSKPCEYVISKGKILR